LRSGDGADDALEADEAAGDVTAGVGGSRGATGAVAGTTVGVEGAAAGGGDVVVATGGDVVVGGGGDVVVGSRGAIGSRCACPLDGGSVCRSGRRGATSGGDGDGVVDADGDACGGGVSRGVNAGADVPFCRPADGAAARGGGVDGAAGASSRIKSDNPANPSTSAAAPYRIIERNDARGGPSGFE
jgi:hypothetical protein